MNKTESSVYALHISHMQPNIFPGYIFSRKDIEPVLSEQGLQILNGTWPGQAMIRSQVVLQNESLVVVHITAYPRYGFTELWRYYLLEKDIWCRRTWQQLPISTRLQIDTAYKQAAPYYALHPGNIPGHPDVSRELRQGPTYLLVIRQEEQLLPLGNKQFAYPLGKPLLAQHGPYHSFPDKAILLIKWHQGLFSTWIEEPFEAIVAECTVSGLLRYSQGVVESKQICLERIDEHFAATPPFRSC